MAAAQFVDVLRARGAEADRDALAALVTPSSLPATAR